MGGLCSASNGTRIRPTTRFKAEPRPFAIGRDIPRIQEESECSSLPADSMELSRTCRPSPPGSLAADQLAGLAGAGSPMSPGWRRYPVSQRLSLMMHASLLNRQSSANDLLARFQPENVSVTSRAGGSIIDCVSLAQIHILLVDDDEKSRVSV